MLRSFVILISLLPFQVLATEFTSGPGRVEVVELFTSEGCSSCPPADRWLSALKSDPALFNGFIPLAFHVDYWNYLGWEDRFARASFSKRQRNYVREGFVSQPYTPGFVVNSREWRGWFRGEPEWQGSDAQPGVLSVTLDSGRLTAQFSGKGAGQMHVAYLGMGLSNEVRAGENRGRRLTHDFVVLDMLSKEGRQQWSLELPEQPDRGQSRTALAVWVTPTGSQSIIQATGGYLE